MSTLHKVLFSIVLSLSTLMLSGPFSPLYGEGKLYTVSPHPLSVESIFTLSDDRDPLELGWIKVREALASGDREALTKQISTLEGMRIAMGLANYSGASLELIEEAEKTSDKTLEALLLESALILSPTHPFVRYKLLSHIEGGTTWEALLSIVEGFFSHPSLVIPLFAAIPYPLLFALTFGFLLSAVFTVISFTAEIVSSWSKRLQRFGLSRGFIVAVIPFLFFLSAYLGPLALVTFVSLLVGLRERWFLWWGGVLLALWGLYIPIQENLSLWNGDDRIHALYRIAENDRSQGDLAALYGVFRERPHDPLVSSSLALTFRRSGKFDEALIALDFSEKIAGESAWIEVERGMLEYLKGDNEKAEVHLEKAKELGAHSAPFYFILSNVKFALSKGEENRAFYNKAKVINPELVKVLEEQEEVFGLRYQASDLGIARPYKYFLTSALLPYKASWKRQQSSSKLLFQPLSSPLIVVVAGILLLLFFHFQATVNDEPLACYLNNRSGIEFISLLPGGLFVSAGKPIFSILTTTTMFATLFVILGWPKEISVLFSSFPDLTPLALFVGASLLSVSYVVGWRKLVRGRKE